MSAPEDTKSLIPTVREVQQMFAELLSHGDDITWDLLSSNQAEILRKKVEDFEDPEEKKTNLSYLIYNPKFFDSIWKQRKFTNGQSLSALFFVMVVDNVSDPKLAEQSRSWSIHPVFRCRRCVDDNTGRNCSSEDCCMVYISQYEAFEDWNTFVKYTRLPKGYMVTPYRGIYKLIDGQVELEAHYIWERNKSIYATGKDRCITPDSLAAAPKCPSHTPIIDPKNTFSLIRSFMVREWKFCSCDRILYLLLSQRDGEKSSDASELSDSLLLFTHTINNRRLALEMIKEQKYHNILGHELKMVYNQISEEAKRIEGKVDLIRSANEVPSKKELDIMFRTKTKLKGLLIDRVRKEEINLEDYGSAFQKHILNNESFDNLMYSMCENLEPEMLMLILKLTQTFVENTREELWQLLKYHFSTETILYQIILCIFKRHSDLNIKDIEEQSSDILRRVRYYFAQSCPNSPPDLLTKCTKCVGYYHISKN
ncbi:uncharacterized protein LOC110190176 [Drosophila serrata]|uniref:uncharacterized protein LOC110190176 n=1 Tax=Drosophila serrata TaxID=7274 RepID=UPI000A1CFFEA|nr:uncharacterized protein LOC110190176 [Drosophila serrata]